jgi:hypothetical protein
MSEPTNTYGPAGSCACVDDDPVICAAQRGAEHDEFCECLCHNKWREDEEEVER